MALVRCSTELQFADDGHRHRLVGETHASRRGGLVSARSGDSDQPEYTVIWAGRGSMPHEIEAARYWVQRENALMRAAPTSDSFLTPKERANVSANGVRYHDTWRSPPKPKAPRGPRSWCRSCGRRRYVSSLNEQRLCKDCRGGRPVESQGDASRRRHKSRSAYPDQDEV